MNWNSSGNIGEFADSLVHSINGNAFSSGYRATKMTTGRNVVIGIESLTKFNFAQTLPELEFYVDAVNYVDLIEQPSFGDCNAVYEHTLGNKHYELTNHLGNRHDTWVLPNKTLSGISPDWSLSGTSGVLVTVTDKKIPEVLSNVEVMSDEFEVDGGQLGWYFDPDGIPSGNYDVTVAGGSMTVEGDEWDHILKYMYFEDGKQYNISFDVVSISDPILFGVIDFVAAQWTLGPVGVTITLSSGKQIEGVYDTIDQILSFGDVAIPVYNELRESENSSKD